MAWHLNGTWFEACSCKVVCPCIMGPAEPDEGWCSAAFGMQFDTGESNGVDLSGTAAAIAFEMPGDFIGGVDRARLYVDDRCSEEQRTELDAIFTGQRGGLWESAGGMIKEWLPTQTVRIDVVGGETPTVRVGDVLVIDMERIRTEDGKQTILRDAPILQAFMADTAELGRSTGGFSDPEMRHWRSGGHAQIVPFAWS